MSTCSHVINATHKLACFLTFVVGQQTTFCGLWHKYISHFKMMIPKVGKVVHTLVHSLNGYSVYSQCMFFYFPSLVINFDNTNFPFNVSNNLRIQFLFYFTRLCILPPLICTAIEVSTSSSTTAATSDLWGPSIFYNLDPLLLFPSHPP